VGQRPDLALAIRERHRAFRGGVSARQDGARTRAAGGCPRTLRRRGEAAARCLHRDRSLPARPADVGPNAARVEVAPHDVFYDPDRRLWYCDIEINQGTSYWPFVRLALARYQPTSLPFAHLSPVVLADFMPLTADRWLNVGRTTDAKKRTLAVFGRRPSGSSGHAEASLVAETTVIAVWVEKLNPAHGEDFGWHKVTSAVVTPAAPTQPVRPQLAAPAVARARTLAAAREFRTIAAEGLIDAVIGFAPLWQGTVTLPEAPGSSRYRLVIAEYEEYPADDTTPYEPPVRAKGQRLVFVEHIELD
jgi:hypothetical protein